MRVDDYAALATDNLRATHLYDRHTGTPEYAALLRGRWH